MKHIIGLLTLIFSLGLSLPVMVDAADSLPAGIIAIAPGKMNWHDAKAFCKSKGGRLPLKEAKSYQVETRPNMTRHIATKQILVNFIDSSLGYFVNTVQLVARAAYHFH